jgi:hypothetical protein
MNAHEQIASRELIDASQTVARRGDGVDANVVMGWSNNPASHLKEIEARAQHGTPEAFRFQNALREITASTKTPIEVSTIDCKCGIYDTEYTMRDYGDKIMVTSPTVKWENNSGSLDFEKTTITNKRTIDVVRKMFEDEDLVNEDQEVLQDILDGNYSHLQLK